MNKKIIIFITMVVIIIAAFGNNLFKKEVKTASSLTKVSVTLDWFPWAGQSGLWVAKEKGYFKEEGLDVALNVPSDPTTNLQTVASGRDDFAMNNVPDVMIARGKDIGVVSIMALVQHPLNVVISLRESGINTPKDLVGRKIGSPGLPAPERVLDTMLKHDGVIDGIRSVELVNVGFDLVPALIGKRVAAIIAGFETYEAISAENQGFPVHVMHVKDYGVPDYYELSLVTSEKKITNNKDLIQRFVQAAKRGYEDAIADPEAAVKLMKKIKPELDLALEMPSIKLLVPLWKSENGVFGWQEENRWIKFGNWMKENNLISKDLDIKKAFNNSFVENASKK